MAQKYQIPEDPKYKLHDIRKIQNSDPANADEVVNPVVEPVLESVEYLKKNKADIGSDGKVPEEQLPEYAKLDSKGKPGGFASLNEQGKVPASELPPLNYVPTSEKGTPGGVAILDKDGKVPEEQLPVQGGLVAQPEPPGNTKLGWIDTGSGNILKYYNGTDWVPIGSVWG